MRLRLMTRIRWRGAAARDERGAILPFIALGLTVLLGATALGVDLGMLMRARTESQRAADAAALAGAGALVASPGNAPLAKQYASTFAAQNDVLNVPVTLDTAQDVQVILDSAKVRVWVRHTAVRGNPVRTIFARILGINTVDVVTVAAAHAGHAHGMNCVLPLAMPDRWQENGGSLAFEDPPDVYIPWDPANPDAPYTGYGASDVGDTIVIKPFKCTQSPCPPNPDWYFPWRPPGQQGAADYRTNINSCVDPSLVLSIGDTVDTEPGAMIGPTKQGFSDLIAMDPNATWNPVQDCVVDVGNEASADPNYCRWSPRIRPMPLFDPRFMPDPGSKPFVLSNFVAVFVDRIQGNDVYGIFSGYTGVSSAGGSTPSAPMFRILQLVE